MISKRQLGLVMPEARVSGRLDKWYPHLVKEMTAHEIVTDNRIAMFVATIAEETGELRAQEENLNYSAARLEQIFPSMFSGHTGLAQELAAQGPEAIANYIYADAHRSPGYRLGNTRPGDGWRYRGRGPMQITGRANYERFFTSLGLPADSNPDLVLAPDIAAKSACHFWKANGCNEIADTGDFVALTRKVNGGTINLATRQKYLNAARMALAVPDPSPPVAPPPPAPLTPPPGYVESPTGNIIREDIRESTIVRDANNGTTVITAATALGAGAPAVAAFSGMDWKLALAIAAIVLAGGLAWAVHKFLQIKAARVRMFRDGIA